MNRPDLHYGFPVAEGGAKNENSSRRGVSLMFALITISLMMTFVSDLILTTSVNTELATSTRDRIKADYMAKSGLNVGVFLLSVSYGVDLFMASSQMGAAKQSLSDNRSSLWTTLNGMPPIGRSTAELAKAFSSDKDSDPFGLAGIMNSNVRDAMMLLEDSFSVQIEDESSKINLSNMRKLVDSKATLAQLIALFSCPVEREFLAEKNLRPDELAYRIFDFVSQSPSSDASDASGLSGRDDPYLEYKPPYRAKRLPFDSVAELKLVKGWDSEIHRVFSPYLTVYPYPAKSNAVDSKININTVSKELLSCLLPESREGTCAETFAVTINEKLKKSKEVADSGIDQTLKQLCYTGQHDAHTNSKPTDWFDTKSTVFRITVTANTGNQERILTGVIRRIPPKDKNFLRDRQDVKRSYELLYFNII